MSFFLRVKSHPSLIVDENSYPQQIQTLKHFLCLCCILSCLFILWDSFKKIVLVSAIYWEGHSFPLSCSGTLLYVSLPCICGPVSGLCLVSSFYFSILVSILHRHNYCDLILILAFWKSSDLSFFKIILNVLRPSYVHTHFRISLSISRMTTKPCRNFSWNALNLQSNWRRSETLPYWAFQSTNIVYFTIHISSFNFSLIL